MCWQICQHEVIGSKREGGLWDMVIKQFYLARVNWKRPQVSIRLTVKLVTYRSSQEPVSTVGQVDRIRNAVVPPKHNQVSVMTEGSELMKTNNSGALMPPPSTVLPRVKSMTPRTQMTNVSSSQLHVSESVSSFQHNSLGAGLEESFASLRRSSATPDLLNSSSVFDPVESSGRVSKSDSAKSRSGSSSPRPKRPPTKESRSVSICETEVNKGCILPSAYCSLSNILSVFLFILYTCIFPAFLFVCYFIFVECYSVKPVQTYG